MIGYLVEKCSAHMHVHLGGGGGKIIKKMTHPSSPGLNFRISEKATDAAAAAAAVGCCTTLVTIACSFSLH